MSSGLPQHGTLPTTTIRPTGDAVTTPSGQLTLDRGIVNATSGSGAPPPPGANRMKQKPPQTKPGKQLSKSSSTPSLRGHIMSDSDLDKKRNKLGYQRISIACAHCRRRKIRCLLSDDDNEQRCQNCIRLKKECVFYPVDQQAAIDAQSDGSSRSGAPASGPSSAVSTSPTQFDVRSFDQQRHPFGSAFQHVPEAPGFQRIPIPSNSLHIEGTYASQDYPYSSQGQSDQPWPPSGYGMQSQRIPTNNNSQLQQPHPQYPNASGADVAPFPSSPSVSQAESFGYPQDQAPLARHWKSQTPLRSMSHSDHYGTSFSQQTPGSYVRPPVFPPPPDSRVMQPMHGQGQLHGHSAYMMPTLDQRSSSVPGVSPYQPPPHHMPPSWYPEGPPHGGYPNRPS